MNNYKIIVNIEMVECEEAVTETPIIGANGQFECVMNGTDEGNIDRCEHALLETVHPAIREALGRHLSAVSKKNAVAQDIHGELTIDPRPYRVDGEVGRIEFSTYRVQQEKRIVYDSRTVFPYLFGKEWYKTNGWKDLVVTHGCLQKSSRSSSRFLNRIRHQADGTPHRTIQYFVEAEGRRVQQALTAQSEEFLTAHSDEISEVEEASPSGDGLLDDVRVHVALEHCEDQLRERGLDGRIQDNPVPYEDREQRVNITIDEVKVKEQKRHRKLPNRKDGQTRKYLLDTVVHVEHGGRQYCLVGAAVMPVLRVLLALLLHNNLLHLRFQWFTDGHSVLHTAIRSVFGWCRHRMQIVLDWYHVEKKCKERLSSAMKGAQIRNAVLQQIMPLLWYGLVDETVTALRGLEPEQIKDPTAIEKLIDYLERNRPYIPCYAARKELGLRNSSNRGEKMNDLLVSDRQKHNGMSWSKEGSLGLASLAALVRNHEQAEWVDQGKLEFKLAA